ncbi:MAG: class C beta-lactamase-related serine hydrolase [Sphingomonadales bacterium]|nr:MAG: class C beta-lactamase-related serine hydrolase [Sphingomonadales bacterium]
MTVARAVVGFVFVITAIAGLTYVWAKMNLDSSTLARAIVWQGADTGDWRRFPARGISASPNPLALYSPDPNDPVVDGFAWNGRPLVEVLEETETTAFLIARGETLIYEGYFNGSSREAVQTSFSVAKSFGSTLIGLAVADGLLEIDEPVTKYVPELRETDLRYDQIQILHLLTMASGTRYDDLGLPWSDDAITYYSPDLRAAALSNTIIDSPGSEFLYNNYNPLLVGMILERATHGTVSEYLERRLWHPMGAEGPASWSLDSESSGFEKMESGINARAVDFLKLGLIFGQKGRIQGREVVPPDWVDRATRRDSSRDPSLDYQYNWWTLFEDGTFSAIGNHGQFILVNPSRGIVLVRAGNSFGGLDYLEWTDILHSLSTKL